MSEILHQNINTKIIEAAHHFGGKVIVSPLENGLEITPSIRPSLEEIKPMRPEVLDSSQKFKNLLQVMGELANGFGKRAHYDLDQYGEGVIIGEEMPNHILQPDEIYGVTADDSLKKKA